MMTDKAKRLFKRAQALFDNLSDQGSVSSLERDLILSYLRDLYDELSSSSVSVSDIKKIVESRDELSEYEVPERQPEQKISRPAPEWMEEPVKEPVEPKAQPVNPVYSPEKIDPPRKPSYESIASSHQASSDTSPATAFVDKEVDEALIALFEFKEVGELSEKLTLQPIDRIEHGMGINERILTVNDLFNGSNELFKRTIDHLNGLQTFAAAKSYLISGVASQYQWAEDNRKKKAQFFIQLVRRKYINN